MHMEKPLVVHVVYRFAVGGLENGVVNLINHLPAQNWRHTIVSLTDVSDEFWKRIDRRDVNHIALHKPPGHGYRLYPRLLRLFRELRPAIVHTRNLAALEAVVPAWFAGVGARIHGEHGRDTMDLDGSSRRLQWVRRAYSPFVTRYIALSQDLAGYLQNRVGIRHSRIAQIYNGVDAHRFRPAAGRRELIPGCPFDNPDLWLIGSVGRMQSVKAPEHLARAFIRALELEPKLRAWLRLVMVGDGALRAEVATILSAAGADSLAWLPGERSDVPQILRGLDCFVLPSLAEGISNTILEAMASGIPVVATKVGGNAELIVEGKTGCLVPSGDVEALARAIVENCRDAERARAQGAAGRKRIEERFSLDAMVNHYNAVYEEALHGIRPQRFAH